MSAFLFFLLPFLTATAGPVDCPADRIDTYAIVKELHDGDTLRLDDQRKVRFVGMNTPEIGHADRPTEPLALEALQRLRTLIPPGTRIGLRYDTQQYDRYHRTLSHVFREDGLNVTAQMIKEGFGFAIVVPPNDWQAECHFRQELQARKDRKGIWGHPYYKPKHPAELVEKQGGFMRISGKIARIGRGKQNLWLDIGKTFAVKLPRKDIPLFKNLPVDKLTGKQITVRGWVSYYNKKHRINLNHPAMLETME